MDGGTESHHVGGCCRRVSRKLAESRSCRSRRGAGVKLSLPAMVWAGTYLVYCGRASFGGCVMPGADVLVEVDGSCHPGSDDVLGIDELADGEEVKSRQFS